MKTYIYSKHTAIITAAVFLFVVYMFTVLLPVAKSNFIIGFSGKNIDNQYIIKRIFDDSPADLAGIKLNDRVQGIDGKPIAKLYEQYSRDFSTYIESITDWRKRAVIFEIERQGESFQFSIIPRQINLAEGAQFFGRRLLFGLLMLSMTVIILVSKTKSRDALLFSACFLFIALWLCAGSRYWPAFLSPLIPDFQDRLLYTQELVSDLALQITCSCLLIISLVFPRKQKVIEMFPRIDIAIFVVPVIILGVVIANSEGSFMSRMQDVYSTRLWLNTAMIISAVILMVANYKVCESSIQREQSKWIIASFAISVFAVVGLWNIPKILVGSGLIQEFDWLLIPFALVPIAMTFAINNHRLFGVRGILGYRLKVLEIRLEREKNIVLGRDDKIRAMDTELQNLKAELKEFSISEKIDLVLNDDTGSKLLDLESRFPYLKKIRKEKLLGTSPAWINVFEDVVLASYGKTPVLIYGESGTGKTELARTIHKLSDRNNAVYKEISCAQFEHADPAISLGKLFGIGTGHGLANVPREGQSGLLEECDGGTLFLDDFDCLPNNIQNLLLYPLEGKPYEPGIGTGRARQVSIKFILATNRDPELLVSDGIFRGDVLARLGSRINVPPLRERKEDIDVLIDHFVATLSLDLENNVSGVSDKARNLLNECDYADGNARQLESELRHAMGKSMLEGDTIIRAGYLSEKYSGPATSQHGGDLAGKPLDEEVEKVRTSRSTADENDKTLAVLRKYRFRMEPSEKELGLSHKSKTLSNYLRGLCIHALSEHDWDGSRAAREIVGNEDPLLVKKIESKINRYSGNIKKSIEKGAEEKLYNNLPARYHPALAKTITRFRSG